MTGVDATDLVIPPQINPKQRAFLERYLNPNSDTFGNASASYKAVYHCEQKSAEANSSRLLARPDLRAAIAALMNHRVDDEKAMRLLSAIAHGYRPKYRKLIVHRDADDNVTSTTEIIQEIDAGTVLKAIELATKLEHAS